MQAMDPLILPDALAYAEAHTTAPPSHLAAVYESTRNDFPMWGMMVGRQEGRFLEHLVFSAQATRVLEIGTFTGYSSIAMAAGSPRGGPSSRSRSIRTTRSRPGATSWRQGWRVGLA